MIIMSNKTAIEWLLQDDNPAVKYRTQAEILGQPANKAPVLEWLNAFLPTDWTARTGLWFRYYITAFPFEHSCADYPFEVMRVGLQNIVEAFCALGYGNDERLREAWELLNSQSDEDEKIILKGTLSKTYLPKERCGKPSKWATFYRLLAQRGTNI